MAWFHSLVIIFSCESSRRLLICNHNLSIMLRVIYLTIFWLHLSEFLLSSQLNRLCDFSLVPSSVDGRYFCCYFCFEFITIKPPITSYGFFSGPALKGIFELYGGIGPPISAAAVLVRKKLCKKGKGSPCSITERRVPELIPVLGSQPAGDVYHKPAVGCHYIPPGLQLPPQPLRGLLPVFLLGEQRHDGREQFT